MLQTPALSMEYQEARGLPPFYRAVGDEFLREVITVGLKSKVLRNL